MVLPAESMRKFLEWGDARGLELHAILPKHVGEYIDGLGSSVSKQHQHLAALRHFFDVLVDAKSPLLPLLRRQSSILRKAPLKKSASNVVSATATFS